jgi:hypothetical protein
VNKDAAQHRADQIAAFRAELQTLAREGAPALDSAALAAVTAHQDALLDRLAREFDVDRTATGRRMSQGMQIAAIIGAVALVAAIVSFFYRFWDDLTTSAQVALLVAAPLAALGAMAIAGRVEKTRYVASLCAIVACGAFVLETTALARMFNLRESPHFLGFWAAFALSVSLPWRLMVPFALGAAAVAVYGAALAFELFRIPWTHAIERPETTMLSATLLMAVAHSRVPSELAVVARGVWLVLALVPFLVLSSIPGLSFLPLDPNTVRVVYQVAAAAVACGVIAYALVRGYAESLVIGSVFAGLFLVTRFVDWWWEWMPKYLFFLIMAAVAIGWLWALRLARRRLEAVT